jgi:hypothetical protein
MLLLFNVALDHLEVSVRNASTSPARLWELENSWGWFAFSFELQDKAGGNSTALRRAPREWTKNGPDHFILQPGETRAFRFDLDDGWWVADRPPALSDKAMRIRAKLSIGESPEARQYGVFVGTLFSDWVETVPPHRWCPSDLCGP